MGQSVCLPPPIEPQRLNAPSISDVVRSWRAQTTRARFGLIIALYVFYVGLSFGIEGFARHRFSVPSKHDISSISARANRVRAELRRVRTRDSMQSWPPYSIFQAFALLLSLVGAIAGTAFSIRPIWRALSGVPLFKVKLIAIGVALALSGSALLLLGPPLLAEAFFERI